MEKKANELKERLLASRLRSKLAPTGADKLKAKPKRMTVKRKTKDRSPIAREPTLINQIEAVQEYWDSEDLESEDMH